MTIEPVILFNLFMIICACWTSFWLGRAYEIGHQSRETRERQLEQIIAQHQARQVRS